jgi:hypothetical protein
MNINFSVEEAVKKRYSVRNYAPQAIEADKNRAIELFVDSLDNPFGKEVTFHYLDNRGLADQQKLGTYGVIKGAKRYIGTSIKVEPMALEALGYELETAMLYLAHLGLGTCWLGGTLRLRSAQDAHDRNPDEKNDPGGPTQTLGAAVLQRRFPHTPHKGSGGGPGFPFGHASPGTLGVQQAALAGTAQRQYVPFL